MKLSQVHTHLSAIQNQQVLSQQKHYAVLRVKNFSYNQNFSFKLKGYLYLGHEASSLNLQKCSFNTLVFNQQTHLHLSQGQCLVDNYRRGEGKWSRQLGKEKGGEGQAREEKAEGEGGTWISSNFKQQGLSGQDHHLTLACKTKL